MTTFIYSDGQAVPLKTALADHRSGDRNLAAEKGWFAENARFVDAYLDEARLYDTHLIDADFTSCHATELQANRSMWIRTRAPHSNFQSSYFNRSNLNFCDFSNANLSDCDFEAANLLECNLVGADLRNSFFQSGANLVYCNLEGANILNAVGVYQIFLPFMSSRRDSLQGEVYFTKEHKLDLRFWAGCQCRITRADMLEAIDKRHSGNRNYQYKAAVQTLYEAFQGDLQDGRWNHILDWKEKE